MYYIEKADKPSKLNCLIRKVGMDENKILVYTRNNKLSERKVKRLAKDTDKLLEKTNSRKIVLSKEMQKNQIYKNLLYSYGYNIIDGKWLFEGISCKALDYIIEKRQIKKEETQISVLVNNLTDFTLENIKELSQEYKTLNVVTNHIEKLKKIQNKIYEESGLMIIVTNNKKKSLMKSTLILNIDFPKELLNKYNIYDEAIIININGNMKIDKKRFNGIVINDYEISVSQNAIQYYNGDIDKYFIKELYEAEFYSNIPYNDFKTKVKNDNLKIKELYGLNGKI